MIKIHKILRVSPERCLRDIKKIIKGKPSRGDVGNLEKLQYCADIHPDTTTQHSHSLAHRSLNAHWQAITESHAKKASRRLF